MSKNHGMTPEQYARLPVYAREAFTRMAREIEELERTLYKKWSVLGPRAYVNQKLVDPRHEEGIIVGPHTEHPLAIHEDFTVRFWIGKASYEYIDVSTRPAVPSRPARKRQLELMGGQVGLTIHPISGNVVSVELPDA